MISTNRVSLYVSERLFISVFIYMIKETSFYRVDLFIVILQAGFLQTFIQILSLICENGVNSPLR